MRIKNIFLVSVFCLFSGFFSPVFAEEKGMTLGDTLTLYFSELFPVVNQEANAVVVKYSGISGRYALRSALQRGIYYGMIPNTSTELDPDRPMTDHAFALLLKKHFGLEIRSDLSPLTLVDYQSFMSSVRMSYSYQLIQELNKGVVKGVENDKATQSTPEGNRLSTADNYFVLDSVYSILHDNYLKSKTINEKDLIYGATEWLVNQLGDQYTKFFRPDASTDFQNSLDGTIVGIWVIIDVDAKGSLLITDVIDHSPAEKAGILPKDRIVGIDGIPVTTEDGIDDDILRLRGQEGTMVSVNVLSGKTTRTVTILREKIQIKLVDTEELPNAFRITYGEVGFGTDKLIKEALYKFLQTGKRRLILDLRNNPGGSMFETRNILNFFIQKGQPTMILRYPRVDTISYATENPLADWSKYEIVILVNHDSASAAEVIASTLREYFPKNSVIIGETSYGKGTVQELVSFDDKSLLKYTVAQWVTPKNEISINGVGIVPDKIVQFDIPTWKNRKIDTQIFAAERYVFDSHK